MVRIEARASVAHLDSFEDSLHNWECQAYGMFGRRPNKNYIFAHSFQHGAMYLDGRGIRTASTIGVVVSRVLNTKRYNMDKVIVRFLDEIIRWTEMCEGSKQPVYFDSHTTTNQIFIPSGTIP